MPPYIFRVFFNYISGNNGLLNLVRRNHSVVT